MKNKSNLNLVETKNDSSSANEKKATGFWSLKNVRFYLGILLCLNFTVCAQMRDALGMGMVCMINSTAIGVSRINNVNSTMECRKPSSVKTEYEGEFIWNIGQQSMLFAAFYWGALSGLPSGWLADRFSPRHLLLLSVSISVICSFLTPTAAQYGGYPAMFAVRVFMGAGQGLQQPAISAFTSRWIPTSERSTIAALYTAGNQLSNIMGMPLNAWLCSLKNIINGWPLIFYVSGSCGFIWCLIWIFSVSNGPEKHKRIRAEERNYILTSLKNENVQSKKEAAKNVPWKSLLTSMPLYACSLGFFVMGIVDSTVWSYTPTYFMQVLGLDLSENGLYSAMPYICQLLLKFIYAALADRWIRSGKLSPTAVSKIFNSVAFVGTAAFLFACGFLSCAQAGWAVAFLSLSMGMLTAITSGSYISMATIAPVYSGIVGAIATTANQIGSILAPYIVGWITTTGSRAEWQLVFGISAAISVFTALFYLLFGSAKLQTWARDKNLDQFQVASTLNIVDCDSPQLPRHDDDSIDSGILHL